MMHCLKWFVIAYRPFIFRQNPAHLNAVFPHANSFQKGCLNKVQYDRPPKVFLALLAFSQSLIHLISKLIDSLAMMCYCKAKPGKKQKVK